MGSPSASTGPKHTRSICLSATIRAMTFYRHIDCPSFGCRLNMHWSAPRACQDRLSSFHIRLWCMPDPIRFPLDNFKHSLTLFSKFFSYFPRILVLYWIAVRGVSLCAQHDGRVDDTEHDTTTRELRVQPPLVVMSIAAGSHLGQLCTTAHGKPLPRTLGEGGARCVTTRQTCLGLMASGATCVKNSMVHKIL
ncbi:hypothetical protein Sango_1059500 [Sesamum angolense]|uniref:Uncharacterized protein n=1 Tax=Sesamum angolense TaxID=2727404 RepID=A0AAE2BZ72_9LAMI|nr:hypothetical protein Sango_1059500 [Sesamum angolense]